LFATLCLIASGLILYVGRGTFLWADDWDFMLGRFGLSPDTILAPHAYHLVGTDVLLYELLRATAGWHFGAYRVAMVLLQVALAVCVFIFARRRLGGWGATVLAGPVLFVPGHATLWFSVASSVASLVAGMSAILVLERAQAQRGRDIVVCALLLLSVFSFSLGVAFALAIGVWLAVAPATRRRLWVAAVPIVAYLAWRVGYSSNDQLTLENLADTPQFVADSAAAGVATLTGLGIAWGRLIALVGAIGIGYELATRRSLRTAETYALISLPLATWALIGLGRSATGPNGPTFGVGTEFADYVTQRFAQLNQSYSAAQSRYVYASVVFIVLLAAQLLVSRGGTRAVWLGAAVLLCGVVTNAIVMRDAGTTIRTVSDAVRGRLAAVELAAGTPHAAITANRFPGGVPATSLFLGHFDEAGFNHAVRVVGSEPVPLRVLRSLGPGAGQALDATLTAIVRPRLEAMPASPPRAAGCRVMHRHDWVAVGPANASIRTSGSPASVFVRRFAPSTASVQVGEVPPRMVRHLTIPRDRSQKPWLMRVVSSGSVALCSS